MANIGTVSFPGVRGYTSWSMTLSHGITPSVCMIDCVPQGANPQTVGNLQFQYDRTRINFVNCLVDSARMRRDPGGFIVGLVILDRRWLWRFGQISGYYNKRKPDGKSIDVATEKTPQALARLLFEAMGEQRYDVSGMPNNLRPECDWDYANPAQELAELCDELGCRIVLGIDNVVRIHPVGVGRPLPNLPTQITQDFGYDPPFHPDSVLLVGGPTRWQTKFKLAPVGEDVEGRIKPIDELSYKPSSGWGADGFLGKFFNLASNLTGKYLASARALAEKSVYRWYKISSASLADNAPDGSFYITGYNKQILHIDQLLPLESGLIQGYIDTDGTERPRPAILTGKYWNTQPDAQNLTDEQRVTQSFSIDEDRGIVMLSEPIYKLENGTIEIPDLWLTVAHGIKDLNTDQPTRFNREIRLRKKPLGTGPLVILREELIETNVVAPMDNTQVRPGGAGGQAPALAVPRNQSFAASNTSEVERQSRYWLEAAALEFETQQTADLAYAGIVPISPDGAIQQVSWASSPGGCFTRASYNSEHNHNVPTYRERRVAERVQTGRANAKKILQRIRRRRGTT
jgi:hypothetical protein